MKKILIVFFAIMLTGSGCISTEIKDRAIGEESSSDGYLEYRNEEIGFSFLYPSDWVLTDYSDTIHAQSGSVVGIKTPDTQELIEARKLPPDSEFNFIVSYWENINNTYAQAGGGSESRYDYESLEEYLNDDVFRMIQMQG